MNINEKLLKIQTELKAPKNQRNSFGNYNFRSCEDILEAVKPLLEKYKAMLLVGDEIVVMGEHSPMLYKEEVYDNKTKSVKEETRVTGSQRYYVKATAILFDAEKDGKVTTTAYAREEETKKGMDASQITGSASSYARKYALDGLFAIDDTKDSDATNDHGKGRKTTDKPQDQPPTMDKEIVDTSLASDKQLNLLYSLVKQKEYTPESMASYIKHNYNKDNSKALTKKEASEVIKMLQDLGK